MASCSLEQARGTRLASASHGGLARAGLGRCCCQGLRRGRGVLDAQAISPMAKKSVSQEMMEECRPHDPDYKGFLLLNPLCVAVLVHTSLHSVCGCVVFNGIMAPPCFVTICHTHECESACHGPACALCHSMDTDAAAMQLLKLLIQLHAKWTKRTSPKNTKPRRFLKPSLVDGCWPSRWLRKPHRERHDAV